MSDSPPISLRDTIDVAKAQAGQLDIPSARISSDTMMVDTHHETLEKWEAGQLKEELVALGLIAGEHIVKLSLRKYEGLSVGGKTRILGVIEYEKEAR